MKHSIKSILLLTTLYFLSCDDIKYHRDQSSETEADSTDRIFLGDKIELVDAKAGLYCYSQPFPPMVILKFKNVSDEDFKANVSFKAIFIKNGEEVCSNNDFLTGPIPAGITKQVAIRCSDYGVTVAGGMGKYHYTVKVYVNNDELLKTINFTGAEKEWLWSERIK
jgi:hypothetical protein